MAENDSNSSKGRSSALVLMPCHFFFSACCSLWLETSTSF